MAKKAFDQNRYNLLKVDLGKAKNVEQWNLIREYAKETLGSDYVSKVDSETRTNDRGSHVSYIHEVSLKNNWPKSVKK